jgi:hypothetical protein
VLGPQRSPRVCAVSLCLLHRSFISSPNQQSRMGNKDISNKSPCLLAEKMKEETLQWAPLRAPVGH